nr:hypothetical protein [Aneurinibacillus sp. XH2]
MQRKLRLLFMGAARRKKAFKKENHLFSAEAIFDKMKNVIIYLSNDKASQKANPSLKSGKNRRLCRSLQGF